MIENKRIKYLNKYPVKDGKHVFYWMQAAQRTELNHALEYAIRRANFTTKPLVVIFCIKPNFPEANARHYYFMLEGLAETQKSLEKRRVQLVVKTGKFVKIITAAAKAYLEELIVRRELAHNFVYYNSDYDKLKATANWAIRILNVHRRDKRQYIYSLKQLENAQTHDRYWNAAQKEMIITGKMNGYMRIYWGKKILEWSKSPQQAFKIALYLSNKYELDGRDPNGYAGICWCFGKHDTAWHERPIFGKVRYMNAEGLRRKFNMEKYVQRVESAIKGRK